MGVYNVLLDLTLGFVSPALGLLADAAGIRWVFIASAIAALLALPIAMLIRRPAAA